MGRGRTGHAGQLWLFHFCIRTCGPWRGDVFVEIRCSGGIEDVFSRRACALACVHAVRAYALR